MRVNRICPWVLASIALVGGGRVWSAPTSGLVSAPAPTPGISIAPQIARRGERNNAAAPASRPDGVFRPRLHAQDGAVWVRMSIGAKQLWLLDDRGALWGSSEDGLQFYPRDFAHIRPSSMPNHPPFEPLRALHQGLALSKGFGHLPVGNLMVLQYESKLLLRLNNNDMFKFPYGTTGEPYLEFTPDSPAFWSAIWAGVPRPGSWSLQDSASFLPRSFQRGISVKTPQLPVFHTLSTTPQQEVVWMGSETGIWRLESDSDAPVYEFPCPDLRCPSVVQAVDRGFIAATEHELIRYLDGKPSAGAIVAGIRKIVVDPADESHLFLVTDQEVFESADEGLSVRSIFVLPAGTLTDALYSPDFNQIVVASSTGVFFGEPATGLKSIPELDGRTSQALALEQGIRGRVFLAVGNEILFWESASRRYGRFQRLPESILQLFSPAAGQLWALTKTQLWELQAGEQTEVLAAQKAWARKVLAKEPPLWRLLEAAYRRHVPRPSRQRLAWAPYLPRVHVMAGAVTGPMRGLLDAVYISQTTGGDGKYGRPTFDNAVAGKDDDAAMASERDTVHTYVVALANWDLPQWVSADVPPAWRREQWAHFSDIESQIRVWMSERRRLLTEKLLSPSLSQRAHVELEVRIEELNVLLESWTGVALPALPPQNPRFENVTGALE